MEYVLKESIPYGPLVKGLRHRLFTAVTRVRIPYGLYFMEDYPSPAEGNGLENRQACKSVRGFESHILLYLLLTRDGAAR